MVRSVSKIFVEVFFCVIEVKPQINQSVPNYFEVLEMSYRFGHSFPSVCHLYIYVHCIYKYKYNLLVNFKKMDLQIKKKI